MVRCVIVCLLISLVVVGVVQGHSHGSEEKPHFKYSREPNGHSHEAHGHSHSDATVDPKQIWIYTMGAVGIISVAPMLVLLVVPDLRKYSRVLKTLLAFAAGGLLGDAFLHLIPHAMSPAACDCSDKQTDHSHHGHSHGSNDQIRVSAWVIGGIFCFLCLEKIIRLFKSGAPGHTHTQPAAKNGQGKSKGQKSGGDASSQQQKKNKTKRPALKVAGYLNLAADFAHNFTDGLAIGGSFLINRTVGYATTFTVLIHELPHELGDYAILVQSGCGPWKAMFLQLTTALGAVLGAGLSLLAAGVGFDKTALGFDVAFLSQEAVTMCLLPFTAGGFIYIALVTVLPDLLESQNDKNTKGDNTFMQSFMEILAMVLGVGLMVVITIIE